MPNSKIFPSLTMATSKGSSRAARTVETEVVEVDAGATKKIPKLLDRVSENVCN